MALDIFDILASVILMFTMMRRVSVKWANAEDFPAVEPGRFLTWRNRSLAAYQFVAWVCVVKVVANLTWVFAARDRVPDWVLRLGGLLLFIPWVIAIVIGWKRVTDLKAERTELGIELGSRAPPRP